MNDDKEKYTTELFSENPKAADTIISPSIRVEIPKAAPVKSDKEPPKPKR